MPGGMCKAGSGRIRVVSRIVGIAIGRLAQKFALEGEISWVAEDSVTGRRHIQ